MRKLLPVLLSLLLLTGVPLEAVAQQQNPGFVPLGFLTSPVTSPVNLSNTALITGTLPPGNGGTGLSALGTGLQYLRTNAGATAIEWATLSAMTNPMTTTGDLITSSSGSTPARIAAVAAGSYFRSAGTSTQPVWSTLTLPNTITSGQFFVGSASNVVTATTMSGDATLSSAGAVTLANSGVSAGSYTNANITVDAKGRVTVAANGSGGSSTFPPASTDTSMRVPDIAGGGAWNDLHGTGSTSTLTSQSRLYNGYTTGSVANDGGYDQLSTPTVYPQLSSGPRWFFRVRTGSSISSIRIWSVATDSAGTIDIGASSAPTGNSELGFRYSTDVDGTAFWRTWVNDGSGAGTAFTTTSAIATNTNYLLCIDASTPTSIKFYINGTLVNTETTNIPAGTAVLTCTYWLTSLNTTPKTFYTADMYYMDHAF